MGIIRIITSEYVVLPQLLPKLAKLENPLTQIVGSAYLNSADLSGQGWAQRSVICKTWHAQTGEWPEWPNQSPISSQHPAACCGIASFIYTAGPNWFWPIG